MSDEILQPPLQDQEAAMPEESIQGVELLPLDQKHLLGADLTVRRNASDDLPERTEQGWKLSAVYMDEQSGRPIVRVKKSAGAEAGASKTFWLDDEQWARDVLQHNQLPVETTGDSTLPKNRLLAAFERDLEEGTAQEIRVDVQDARHLGEPAVEKVIEIDENVAKAIGKDTPDEFVEDRIAQPDEAQPSELEPRAEPTPAEIFSNPDTLVKALRGSEVSPELRQNLGKIVEAWQELGLIDTTGKIWTSVIAPQLQGLTSSAENSAQSLNTALDITDRLQRGLSRLAGAIEYRDMTGAAEIMRSMQIGQSIDDFMNVLPRALDADEFRGKISRLRNNTEDADVQLRRKERITQDDFSVEDADQLISEVGPLAQNITDLAELAAIMGTKAKQANESQPAWRARLDAVHEISGFARAGVNALPETVRHLANQLEVMRDQMRRNRYDAAEMHHLSRMIRPIAEDIEYSRKMSLRVIQYSRNLR